MSQSRHVDEEEELDRAFDEMGVKLKKKKCGRGRSAVAHDERLPHPQAMFRNKINTAMSNMSHIVHQTGCNAIIILNDGNRVDTYVSPQWRGSYRDHPEAYGTLIHMAKEYEEHAMAANPMDHKSYSVHLPYTPVEIKGNVRNAVGDEKEFGKRTMDSYMSQQLTTIPLHGPHDDEDDEDEDVLEGIRKKLMAKRNERDKEENQQEKDIQISKELRLVFENANVVSTGPKKAPRPSFVP